MLMPERWSTRYAFLRDLIRRTTRWGCSASRRTLAAAARLSGGEDRASTRTTFACRALRTRERYAHATPLLLTAVGGAARGLACCAPGVLWGTAAV